MVKRFSDEELVSYRMCNDPAVEGCLQLLSQAAGIAFLAERLNDVVFIGMLMCYISLTKGFTKFSANSFGTLAMVFTKMGDYKAGRRYGKLSLEISDRFQAKECDGNTMLVYYGFIHHTSKPMPELLDPLLEASEIAKAGGDIASCHHAFLVYTFTYMICGLPLTTIQKDAKSCIDEMKHYRFSTELACQRLLRQMALNLIHWSANPFELEGDEIPDLQALFTQGNEAENKRVREAAVNCQLYLVCYLGKGDEGKDIVAKHTKLNDHEHPMSFTTFFPYQRGIVLLRLARKGCRKSKRLAAREIRRTREYVRKGYINCTHLLHILEAGMLSISKKSDSVVRVAYDKAIACAARSGFPNDAGLASEHAAAYFCDRDPPRSAVYLERAIDFYRQWGAGAKVESLEDKEGHSDNGDGLASVGSTIRGRSRRNPFHLNPNHETSDWFDTISAKLTEGRRNLGIRGRRLSGQTK